MFVRHSPVSLAFDCISRSSFHPRGGVAALPMFGKCCPSKVDHIYNSSLKPETTTSNIHIVISLPSRMLSTSRAGELSSNKLVFQESFRRDANEGKIPLGGESSGNHTKSDIASDDQQDQYSIAVSDLNRLQSNTQVVALAKYKNPEKILPFFEQQLNLAGIQVEQLNKLNVIHISGTKGKGSTCAFVESILRKAGLKTGFYNSPHLIKVTERIRINGKPIDDIKFSRYFRVIFDRLQEETMRNKVTMPSYFSFLTILAFHIFLEEKVDCAIVEVGIGGDYDPTNIVQRPVACGITTLDYDHTNILGNTIGSIAWSKAGIAKTGVPLYTVEHEVDEVFRVIESRARERGCPLYVCKSLEDPHELPLGINGAVQYRNASLATHIANHYLKQYHPDKCERIESSLAQQQVGTEAQVLVTSAKKLPQLFRDALSSCNWPGRCQTLKFPRATFFVDGAHTRKSMENCLEWFIKSSNAECLSDSISIIKVLMVNVIGERDKHEVLKPLAQYDGFDLVLFSSNRINSAGDTPKSETFVNIQSSNSEKSMENVKSNVSVWNSLVRGSKIGEQPKLHVMQNTSDCVRTIDKISRYDLGKKYHVLATGSLHFVGALLETLPSIEELSKD